MITQIPSKIIKILGNNELVEEPAGFPAMSWDTPCGIGSGGSKEISPALLLRAN